MPQCGNFKIFPHDKVTFSLKSYTVNWFLEKCFKWGGENFRHYYTALRVRKKVLKNIPWKQLSPLETWTGILNRRHFEFSHGDAPCFKFDILNLNFPPHTLINSDGSGSEFFGFGLKCVLSFRVQVLSGFNCKTSFGFDHVRVQC